MGYTTEFEGRFELNRPLEEKHQAYLAKFSETRRMKRRTSRKTTGSNTAVNLADLKDPIREAVGLPVGTQGDYYVGAGGYAWQDTDEFVLDYNEPPDGQPGLWCKWVPSSDGKAIEWDGAEKFYNYVEWLQYLLDHFLTPWGYTLRGSVRWQGEFDSDVGVLCVVDGKVLSARSDLELLTNEGLTNEGRR